MNEMWMCMYVYSFFVWQPTRPNNLAGSRKKNESCDTVPTSEKLVEKASKGVEGFAAPNKPSKHLTRKAKKQAKRDAKVNSVEY